MKRLHFLLAVTMSFFLTACGSGGGGTGTGTGTTQASATSQLCTDVIGLEAIYWDFINGVIRVDLPQTAFTIPANFTPLIPPYTNSNSILLGFTSLPLGWSIADGIGVSGFEFPATVAIADMTRNDNQAKWRYIFNAQVTGGYTSAAILDAEVTNALNAIGNPTSTTEQCQISMQQVGIIGLESVAAKVIRAGGFTIMARIHVIVPNGPSGLGYYDGHVSYAPANENPTLINDAFVPMITQLYGGGTSPSQCEDGIDNDGDGMIDLADSLCTSPSDDSESS